MLLLRGIGQSPRPTETDIVCTQTSSLSVNFCPDFVRDVCHDFGARPILHIRAEDSSVSIFIACSHQCFSPLCAKLLLMTKSGKAKPTQMKHSGLSLRAAYTVDTGAGACNVCSRGTHSHMTILDLSEA